MANTETGDGPIGLSPVCLYQEPDDVPSMHGSVGTGLVGIKGNVLPRDQATDAILP